MSYLQFQQECKNCGKQWNAAFGIVGNQQIAAPPKECPHCRSTLIIHVADGWLTEPQDDALATMKRNGDLARDGG